MENYDFNDGLKIYSEEVRDILSDPPKAILRWGNTILLGFIFVLLILSYLIKYPDVIATQILITTNIPPEKLVTKVSGKIKTILVKDKSNIVENTALAVIENSANFSDVFKLKRIVDSIDIDKNPFPFNEFQNAQFGEIESAFAIFQKESLADGLNKNLQPFQVNGSAQSYEAIQLKERLNLLESQKSINQNEMALQKNDLDRNQSLFQKGIIAAQELEKHKLTYLQVERNYKSLLSNISSLKSSLIELNRNSKTNSINENKENVNLERNVFQAFYQLKKAIKDWELNYVLRSSIAGKVSFLQIWSENQFVSAGENVFSIIPSTQTGYIGKVKATALNSGKIKIGQDVNIRLSNFSDREFGMLLGKIKNISLTPDKEGNLLIDVSLQNGLQTTYKKQITFQQEMSGSAEIITEDLRLLERILYQFRDIFRR
jgi:multidrug efflux pump subunit AcrA (membrane-fusion protein)